MPVYALSVHLPYVCRHAGACCTAGWAVPIDGTRERRLVLAIEDGTLRVPVEPPRTRWCERDVTLDEATLALDASGTCVFFDRPAGRRCAIQSACGHDAIPLACQQFPRVTLADDRGYHVTLSHFCPTAASLLFEHGDRPVEISDASHAFPEVSLAPGLDARGQWPPLLRPGVLSTLAAWTRWEQHLVEALGGGVNDPFEAAAEVAVASAELAAWTPRHGQLDEYTAKCLARRPVHASASRRGAATLDAAAEHAAAVAAVPRGRLALRRRLDDRATVPGCLESAAQLLVRRRRPAGRYLAARAFANWCAYQAPGVRSSAATVATTLGVLQVEAAGLIAEGGSGDDDRLLLEAIRRADWLLVHLAEGDALARYWTRAASAPSRFDL
jgi:Fe-S-cluster containining protein